MILLLNDAKCVNNRIIIILIIIFNHFNTGSHTSCVPAVLRRYWLGVRSIWPVNKTSSGNPGGEKAERQRGSVIPGSPGCMARGHVTAVLFTQSRPVASEINHCRNVKQPEAEVMTHCANTAGVSPV